MQQWCHKLEIDWQSELKEPQMEFLPWLTPDRPSRCSMMLMIH